MDTDVVKLRQCEKKQVKHTIDLIIILTFMQYTNDSSKNSHLCFKVDFKDKLYLAPLTTVRIYTVKLTVIIIYCMIKKTLFPEMKS